MIPMRNEILEAFVKRSLWINCLLLNGTTQAIILKIGHATKSNAETIINKEPKSSQPHPINLKHKRERVRQIHAAINEAIAATMKKAVLFLFLSFEDASTLCSCSEFSGSQLDSSINNTKFRICIHLRISYFHPCTTLYTLQIGIGQYFYRMLNYAIAYMFYLHFAGGTFG